MRAQPHMQQYRHDSISSEQSSSMEFSSQTRSTVTGPKSGLLPPDLGSITSKKHGRNSLTKRTQSVLPPGGGGLAPNHRHSSHPQRSFSSSEDELRSTPDYTSCEEHESERGTL